MIFEAKILIIRKINENRQRKKWLRGTGRKQENTEKGTKKPSAKPGNRMPRVKVLNYLKKVTLFFRFERDILADGAQVIGRDAEERRRNLLGFAAPSFLFHKSVGRLIEKADSADAGLSAIVVRFRYSYSPSISSAVRLVYFAISSTVMPSAFMRRAFSRLVS